MVQWKITRYLLEITNYVTYTSYAQLFHTVHCVFQNIQMIILYILMHVKHLKYHMIKKDISFLRRVSVTSSYRTMARKRSSTAQRVR